MNGERRVRTWCGSLRPEHEGQTVRLNGWMHRRRDFGGLVFVDVRDRSGIVQVVFDPASGALHERAGSLRPETCMEIEGVVIPRSAENLNPKMATGGVEVAGRGADRAVRVGRPARAAGGGRRSPARSRA